jgi:ribosome biogenesis protein ENP2
MHGYFISLKLYDAARVIANPFAYAEHREKMVRDKMEKMAETRIRTKKDIGVKVNQALAEKILREEEKLREKEERRRLKKAERQGDTMDLDQEVEKEEASGETKPTLLNDPRFSRLFVDPKFAVDEGSREYALMHPSASGHGKNGKGHSKTAVEEEEEESDKASSDGLGGNDSSSESGSGSEDRSNSSDAGGESSLFFTRSWVLTSTVF